MTDKLYGQALGITDLSINNFKSLISKNPLLNPTRFRVILPAYKGQKEMPQELLFNCSAVSWPGKSISSAEHNQHLGPIRKVPNGELYEDTTLTFFVTEEMLEMRFFSAWHDLIMGGDYNQKGFYVGYYNDLIEDITIQALSKDGKVKSQITLFEAYPTNISNIDFSYDAVDTIATATIDFAYHHWQYTDIKEPTKSPTDPFSLDFRGNVETLLNQPGIREHLDIFR